MYRVVTKLDYFTQECIATHGGIYEYPAYSGCDDVVLEIAHKRFGLSADKIRIPNGVAFEICRSWCGAGKELKVYLDQFDFIIVNVFGYI